jgi:outer membrane protein OmpA-like peptidoglycan-associated protein
MQKLTIIAVLATGMALAGCSNFYGPAGEGRHSHLYGVATAQNTNAQIAYGDPASRIRALNEAFRAAAPDTVTFPFDSANLDASARAALDQQAAWLTEHEDVRMSVVGHTDLVGPPGYNQRLGLRRALTAVNYLVRKGVDRDRLDAVISRGETEPVVETEDRERRNRRAVTSVAGFTHGYVGEGMDGRIAVRLYRGYVGQGTGGVGEAGL